MGGGGAVTPFVLAVLKYSFLALIYFFVYRAIRAVATDISVPRKTRAASRAETKPVRTPRATRSKKAPTTLVVRDDGGKKVASHRLESPLQVGRADACHIRLNDTYVSQFHARIYPRDGTWHVEDLGSTNGTYLNRQRLSGSREVQAGDQIKIGKTTLELKR